MFGPRCSPSVLNVFPQKGVLAWWCVCACRSVHWIHWKHYTAHSWTVFTSRSCWFNRTWTQVTFLELLQKYKDQKQSCLECNVEQSARHQREDLSEITSRPFRNTTEDFSADLKKKKAKINKKERPKFFLKSFRLPFSAINCENSTETCPSFVW